MENTEKELTPEEKALLNLPDQGAELPPYLYTKIVQAMKTEALLPPSRPLLTWSLQGILTALLVLAIVSVLGYWAGKTTLQNAAPIAVAETGKAKFVLLVHNDDLPAADPMQQVKEYGTWLHNIREKRVADGEHLHSGGWVLSKAESGNVNVEAKSEFPGRQEIGGYFIFEAESPDEAVRVAQTCPHLNYKGTLELRQIH